jgi:hypothetical protein
MDIHRLWLPGDGGRVFDRVAAEAARNRKLSLRASAAVILALSTALWILVFELIRLI